MKRKLICVFMFVSMFVLFSEDAAVQTSTLTVTVVNAKNDKGVIGAALCNSRQSYENPNAAMMGGAESITDGQSVLVFENIPNGVYAVKLIHDENSNGKLDTGLFGIPKEDYAFSNNVPGPFGPPDFEKVKFTVDGDTDIEISLN